jgi:hypothetical protein
MKKSNENVGKFVVVTTDKDRRGVFGGILKDYDRDKQIAILTDAQMAVYWSAETKGVLGLASQGPQKGSKITPVIPEIELNGVTSVITATKSAMEEWRKEKWN